MGINYTAATFATNHKITAAEWATEVTTPFNGLQAAWTSYTPAWTSSGTAPVLNNGTIVGKYMQVGKTIDFAVLLTPGSTTTFGTLNYSISLPPSLTVISDGMQIIAHAQLLIGGVRWHGQLVISSGATTCQPFFSTSSADPRLTQMTPTAPGTFATGNTLRLTGRYEAA